MSRARYKWLVAWDNGLNACGTFPWPFDTEKQAQRFADDWAAEMRAIDPPDPDDESGDTYTAEPVRVKL